MVNYVPIPRARQNYDGENRKKKFMARAVYDLLFVESPSILRT